MKQLFIFLLSALVCFETFAQHQSNDVIDKLNISSSIYLASYIEKNWDVYLDMTYNNIITLAGGEKILIEMADQNIKMYESLGFTMAGIGIGLPRLIPIIMEKIF